MSLSQKNNIALRIDDVGAATKKFEVYSHRTWLVGPFAISGNWLFLKYLPSLKAWGPYREMKVKDWDAVYSLLSKYNAKLTVAVTAAWVESQDRLIPFPKKFPQEAAILKEGLQSGLLEIANHGLTHCVVQDNAFKPKWFSSNRKYHREFWEWIPIEIHERHLQQSQDILQTYFGIEIVTFVPPGNKFTEDTLEISQRYGIRYVSCRTPRRLHKDIAIVGDEQVFPFHDREIVLYGVSLLEAQIERLKNLNFCFVKDLGKMYFTEAQSG